MSADPRPLVVHVVNALDRGGTEGALLSLLPRFDGSRHGHAVVTLRGGGPLAAELPSDVACWAIGAKGRSRAAALRLAGVARRWRPAIIHARNTNTWADALVAGVLNPRSKVILGFHGLDHAGGFPGGTRRLARWAVRLGAAFASVSESGRSRLVEELGVPSARIALLPNGVDAARFRTPTVQESAAARRALGVQSGEFVVGMVGSLTAVKRVDLMIEALRRLAPGSHRVRGIVVGEGSLRSELQDLTLRAGLRDRVHFAGSQADVRPYLWALEVLVSGSDSEEMSNAILEALACGIPIVATNVGDSALMIGEPRAGIVAPKGDAAAISAAILRLACDPSERARLGRNARLRAAGCSLARTAAAYDEFYRSLLGAQWRAAAYQPNHTANMVMSSLCGAGPTNTATCLRT